MTLNIATILDAIATHAQASGYFENVLRHEPKNAPGNGMSAAIFLDRIGPLPEASGLAATTTRLEFKVRLYSNMLQEPQDDIDLNLIRAVDALFTAYSGHFTLAGNVREIDVLGSHGEPLQAQAGYLSIDNSLYRVMTITFPVVVNDAWVQGA